MTITVVRRTLPTCIHHAICGSALRCSAARNCWNWEKSMAVPWMERAISVVRWWDVYLGHGRMTEALLVFVEAQYALMFLLASPFVIAFQDLPYSAWLAAPFAVAALLSGAGLLTNAMGYPVCHALRIVGAAVGMTIWLFLLAKNVFVGIPLTSTTPWMVAGVVASVWIIRRGMAGLPIPGAPGAR